MSPTNADGPSGSAGSVGEEALRLLDALSNWAGQQAAQEPAEAAPNHEPPHICRVCPVCRVGSMLEAVSPEAIDRIADLVAMLAGSLHAAAEHRRTAPEGADTPEQPAHAEQGSPPSSTKIPLTDSELATEGDDPAHD